MSASRIAALVLLGAACAAALFFWVYGPVQCMRTVQSVSGLTARSEDAPGHAVTNQVRTNLAELEKIDRFCASDVRAVMLKAANLRLVGRTDEALSMYRRAAEIEPRPEIYYSMGLLLAEERRFDEAVEPFAVLVAFDKRRQFDVDRFSEELGRRVQARIAASPRRQ